MKKLLIIGLILATTGCASAVSRHQQVQAEVAQPINCATADADIASLEQERTSAGEKIVNGIATLLPTSAVFNLLTGEWSSRRAIASGKLDDTVFMRIDEIKSACDPDYVSSY